MKVKNIVVALKYFKGELNPFDASALEAALTLDNVSVTVLAMAPLGVKESLKGLTRLGVKAVLISDNAYAGSDTVATSLVLAKAIKGINPDCVFCGRQSVDGDTAQIPPMLAQRLDYRLTTGVIGLEDGGLVLRNGKKGTFEEKTVYTFEKSFTLRFPSIFSKAGEVELIDNSTLKIPKDDCGLLGSTTRVVKTYESNVGRRYCKFVDASEISAIIRESRNERAATVEKTMADRLDKIYYVGNIKKVADAIAENSYDIKVDGKSPNEIADYILNNGVKNILWEDSDLLKIIAARVAVIINAGLCADCISFTVTDGKLVMTRPAQGGSVTADIISTGSVAMATVRTANKKCSDIIFSVGKGGVPYIDKIKELAKKYGAEICCSRWVADGGFLPYSAQVGLTGKTVCPRIYVAFGISGAVQHVCAIANAQTVIAINNDREARIFDYADYGIKGDIKDVEL